jgi:Tfp pilus assembly protein PilN
MASPNTPASPTFGSFIPEDYLRRKAETRSNIINLLLFGVVLFAVIAAFFVTNRQWDSVRSVQTDMNKQFTAEASKIEQLKLLEGQKAEMVEKAEITAALLERIPRSILMAELINRMPEKLTLTELELKSSRPKEVRSTGSNAQPKSLAVRPVAGAKPAAKNAVPEKPPTPRPQKIDFAITLTGFAASDTDVADYHAKLKECPLLEKVELVSAKEATIDEVAVREFRIEAVIRDGADARSIEPLQVPRLRKSSRVVGANAAIVPNK